MELTLLLAVILTAVFAETTYLTVRAVQPAKVKNSILLDTSVLIDGRIVSIARSGLMSARLVVPRSVVRELQFMADKADHDKRERARFGLDVIEQLQGISSVTISVVDDGTTSASGVDEQLMNLARKWSAKLCTIDYNLNKSARVLGIEVININELAHALRVLYLPGEKFDVKLQQSGQESHQAVGYLDDGTMVVVDNAKSLIGKTIAVEVTRVLQTTAGKMMFAKHGETVRSRPQTRPSKEAKAKKEPSLDAKQRPARKNPEAKKQPNTQSKPKQSTPRQSNNRRRPQTNEERLVALANKD